MEDSTPRKNDECCSVGGSAAAAAAPGTAIAPAVAAGGIGAVGTPHTAGKERRRGLVAARVAGRASAVTESERRRFSRARTGVVAGDTRALRSTTLGRADAGAAAAAAEAAAASAPSAASARMSKSH